MATKLVLTPNRANETPLKLAKLQLKTAAGLNNVNGVMNVMIATYKTRKPPEVILQTKFSRSGLFSQRRSHMVEQEYIQKNNWSIIATKFSWETLRHQSTMEMIKKF